MKMRVTQTVPLGDLVVAVFDAAAQHSSDSAEVSRLATRAVAHLLRDAPARKVLSSEPVQHERKRRMSNIINRTLVVTAIGVALLVASGPASAQWLQRSDIDRRGVYVGLTGMGNFVVNQANAPVNGFIGQGGGFGLAFGVRIAPMFALELAYSLNVHNPVQYWTGEVIDALLLHAGTLDLKILFPNQSIVRPYVQAGAGVYELASYADYTQYRNGIGFRLGGGLDIWLNRIFTLGGRALYHGIFFTQHIGADRPFLSTVSVEVNFQAHF
jgi:hypothetical protein